ncbi:E3 ubiquitin-protein ligase RGLG3 [Elaeis guineensis]|uniref:E3 ubiquitin-protein ligase RGLG1 n=1 Tax=Elaeis guineensis var. tenera TaxID=51953 RepID=A0A6I9Q858_ELAGV|nr:E3 ubiquitin-protein ligase RGLG1 [Elaeis guineensis]XP_029116691.1 E3 ubiquitin-protein ligase RGLG1 [Elaeis guineensis]
MEGKSFTEASSRNVKHSPTSHGRSYRQEQVNQSSSSHEWTPYPLPSEGHDSSSRDYPVPQRDSPPKGYTPQGYLPQTSRHPMPPQFQNPSSPAAGLHPKLDKRYSKITDHYNSLEEVTEALAKAGLESSNLIVGIDFTKSNEWTGKHSFNHHSLHYISDIQNPYEQAISIIGKTLSTFDEDNLIPCFGFGDASTHDQDVFSFYPDERPCNGFAEALARYREIVPHLRLAGPTSFAPIIEMAMTIVEQSRRQYHVLLIIADGQVTRSVDTEFGQLSSQEHKTVDAIVKASEFPLSIILVGVGDGPWDMMKEFDDNIPARSFDNFQFVNFTATMSKNIPQTRKETEFALAALMEIPAQYKATVELGILGHEVANSPERVPLPPPIGSSGAASSGPKAFGSTGYRHSAYKAIPTTAPTASASWEAQVCPVCLSNPRDMAFGCGHQTCCDCGPKLTSCPICRSSIQTRIKLY